MTTSWPEHTLDEYKFNNVFQLAQTFELHCAKIYNHASTHPDGSVSAHYVMQLVSQAYRAVHSLHMQQVASSCLDLDAATAALENKAVEYRESLGLSSADENPVQIESADEQAKSASPAGLKGLLDGDFEEEDSDWESSEEETDDEYYEYNEGSDSDCDSVVNELAAIPEIVLEEEKPVDTKSPLARSSVTESQKPVEEHSPSLPPISITQDKAMHDRITAAFQTLSLPRNEPDGAPLTRVESHIDCPPNTDSVTPTDDTHSEATTVQVESRQELPQEIQQQPPTPLAVGSSMRSQSLTTNLQRKLSRRSSSGSLRRLKTVYHKYVGRVLVPIRGKSS